MGFKAKNADPNCICNYTSDGTEVIDSRTTNHARRRRRACPKCHRRFTTYEMEIPKGQELRVFANNNGVTITPMRVVKMPVIQS